MLKCLIYTICHFLVNIVAAQNFTTTTYAAEDGLLDDRITAISKDNRQLLWLGTPFGVNWFDGQQFYEPEMPARTGQVYITRFYKDQSATIWTLTFYNGIYKYTNGKFINYLPQADRLTSNRNNVFCMVQVDSSHYIIGTDENVFWFDGLSFTPFDKGNTLLNRQFNCVEKGANNTILLGADNGLWQFQLANRSIASRQLVLKDHRIYNILVHDDKIWVATNRGLYQYKNSQDLRVQSPQLYLKGHTVVAVCMGKQGLWITAEKMYLLKDSLLNRFDEASGLPPAPANVFYDAQGITWFTSSKGLSRLNNNYYQYLDLRAEKGHPMIICVEKNKNDLWLGSYGGLTKISGKSILSLNEHGGKKLNYISWIKKRKDGELLAATEAGIIAINGNRLKKKYDLISTKAFEDDEGNLWLGTVDGRLFKIANDTLQEIKLVNSVPDFIDAILFDRKGFLWIGYRNNGIIKFRLDGVTTDAVRKYNQANGFPDLRIRCGTMDKSGNLLFGTRTNGLFVFSTKDDTYNHITTKSGLAGNWVKSISVDERNNIYAATNKGVDMIRVINQEPAIRKLQLSQSSLNAPVNFVLAANDSVWIGTDSGLITYMPLKDIVDSTPPHIYLIQLSINGKNDSTFIPYARSLENYTLPHNRNIIALRFSGAYLQAGNVKYTYRLKGQDDNWSEPDTRNFVSYNLPPGKYDFEVHAISSSGVRSVYPSSLSITILAPFYKTIWFLIACITIAMWLIYMLYRYRIAQVTKLENMRSRISADLHDDLGSGLSRIKFLSETMKLNNNRDASLEKNLNKISLYADEMADKIGEIVWALNNKNDKLADLIAYMRSYAMEYLTNHGISCTADTPAAIPELIIDGETRRNIFLAMKEILFNIVKHARADRVDFKITIQKSFQLIIHDNGIGIDLQNVRKLGNGLSNISERMRHSRGSAAISNENGTKIILNVPLLHT